MHAVPALLPLLWLACAAPVAEPPAPAPAVEAPAPAVTPVLDTSKATEWNGVAVLDGTEVPAVIRVTPWSTKPDHFFAPDHPEANRMAPSAEVEVWLDLEGTDPLGLRYDPHWLGHFGARAVGKSMHMRIAARPVEGPCAIDGPPTAAQASEYSARLSKDELIMELVESGPCPGATRIHAMR